MAAISRPAPKFIPNRSAPQFIPINGLSGQQQIEVLALINYLRQARHPSNLFKIDISPINRSPIVCVVDSFYHSLSYRLVDVTASKAQLSKTYLGLRSEKWRECIDGQHHDKGKFVYDLGLHGGPVEPGFIGSMESVFQFILPYLNREIDSLWYLKLHEKTCAHFNGGPAVGMGQEKVGVFRTSDDHLFWILSGKYALTPEARSEFEELDLELKREFGESYGLGEMVYTDPSQISVRLNYKVMSREQVTEIFNKFLRDFYYEVARAETQDQKLWAIARLHQRLEWLHPVRDGTGRTDNALLNKLLTEYGFHPAILIHPYVSTSYGLAQWKHYLEQGLIKWENAYLVNENGRPFSLSPHSLHN